MAAPPRSQTIASITIISVMVVATAGVIYWTLHSPLQVQRFLIRLVVVSLLLFLVTLFLRYFTLLWFGYLQHAERTIKGPPTDETFPPVSVVVPAYNEALVLDGALEGLLKLDYPEYEVILIDDGSTDDTLEIAKRWEGQHGTVNVRVFTKANGGKATALNAGIDQARYGFVLCMDADAWIEPQSLKVAMPHFADESIGAVAGNVKVVNRDHWLARLQALEYIEGLNMPRRAQGFMAAVNIVPGPLGVFRVEALQDVGGYDDDTFAEDADLTMKLVASGWKIIYEDKAITWTHGPTNALDLIQQRYRWTRGILQALRKRKSILWHPFPDFPLWLSSVEMAFEGVLWPILNVYAHLFFAMVALLYGMGELLLYWWVLLTVLDMVVALITVAMEEEDLILVPYALIYRFAFILFLDVAKTLAAIEELFNLGMSWGKLRRVAYGHGGH